MKGLLQPGFGRTNPILLIETDPNAAAPIAASLVLTPAIPLDVGIGPLPIVAVDMKPYIRRVIVGLLRMPAKDCFICGVPAARGAQSALILRSCPTILPRTSIGKEPYGEGRDARISGSSD